MNFDTILEEIANGMNGDNQHDCLYLLDQIKNYQNHQYSQQILSVCTKLLSKITPSYLKEHMLKQFVENFNSQLKEAYQKKLESNFYDALYILEPLIKKLEQWMNDGIYGDIPNLIYYDFDDLFQEVLFFKFNDRQKTKIARPHFRLSILYLMYGNILYDLNRIQDAQNALRKALRWNPMNSSIALEYSATFQKQGNLEEFFKITISTFKIVYDPANLAHCYRNLGYYFSSKQMWSESLGCYLISLEFNKNSQIAQSEIAYIVKHAGSNLIKPSSNDMANIGSKYGFPIGPNKFVLHTSISYGQHYFELKKYYLASQFFNIAYSLTNDQSIKKTIDKIDTYKSRIN